MLVECFMCYNVLPWIVFFYDHHALYLLHSQGEKGKV